MATRLLDFECGFYIIIFSGFKSAEAAWSLQHQQVIIQRWSRTNLSVGSSEGQQNSVRLFFCFEAKLAASKGLKFTRTLKKTFLPPLLTNMRRSKSSKHLQTFPRRRREDFNTKTGYTFV